MKCKYLFEKIDELYDDYVEVWENICRIESPTAYKVGVDEVGKFVIAIAQEHGWNVEIHEEKISGNAIAITMNPEALAEPVVFSAHMDTVHPVGSFGNEVVRRDENYIYGPGVLDCKGGIVQSLLAMHALEAAGFKERPIILLLQSDEEVGSRTSQKRTVRFMCEKAKNAVAFLNLEGSSEGYAILSRKGIVYYTFKIKGIEAHSSLCATRGANAIEEAAHKIIEIAKIKDAEGVTCNCGVISGGSVPNTVPGECSFSVNIRYVNSEQLEWVTKEMQRIADTVYVPGCSTTLLKTGERVAMELKDKNVELLDKINKIFAESGLSTLKAGKANGGSDAADVTHFGIPCIDSLGVTGGDIHSPGEFGTLKSLNEYAKRIASIAYCIE